jgi:hypothetical protein
MRSTVRRRLATSITGLPRCTEAPGCGFSGEKVEAYVKRKHGANHLKDRQAKAELASVNRELRRLKTRIAELERRKTALIAAIGN